MAYLILNKIINKILYFPSKVAAINNKKSQTNKY